MVAGLWISDLIRVSVIGFRISIALMVPLLSTSMVAQTPLSNLVYTVGTTIRDNSNQDWSYLLLNTSDPQMIADAVALAGYAPLCHPVVPWPSAQKGASDHRQTPYLSQASENAGW